MRLLPRPVRLAASGASRSLRQFAGTVRDRHRRTSRWERLKILIPVASLVGLAAALAVGLSEERWIALRYSAPAAPEFHDDLVLVALDEPHAERTLYAPTLRLDLLAELIDSVAVRRPATLALDVLIEGTRIDTLGFAAYERALVRADSLDVRVVLPIRIGGYGAAFETGRNVRVVASPSATLDSLAVEGYVDYAVQYSDPAEGIAEAFLGPPAVLDVPLAAHLDDGTLRLSFAAAAAAAHEGTLDRDEGRGDLPLGTVDRALKAFGRPGLDRGEASVPIHYEGPATPNGSGRPRVIPADELAGPTATADVGPLHGALVLIAATYPSPDGSDTATTPFGIVRGGIVQFHALDTLLRRAYPVRWPQWPGYLLGAFLATLAIGLSRRSIRAGALVTLALLAVYLVAAFALAESSRTFLPMAVPVWGAFWGIVAGYVLGRHDPDPRPLIWTPSGDAVDGRDRPGRSPVRIVSPSEHSGASS